MTGMASVGSHGGATLRIQSDASVAARPRTDVRAFPGNRSRSDIARQAWPSLVR